MKAHFLAKVFAVIIIPILLLSLPACSKSEDNSISLATTSAAEVTTKATKEAVYMNINAEKAKSIMDSGTDYIILDVRTKEEFRSGHIPNAVLIPYDEIEALAEEKLPDKDKMLLIYCRSGRRSKIAAESLVDMGYTNIMEFGGINQWGYEIVTGEE